MNYNEPSIKKKREELSSPKKRRRTTASAVAFRVILFLICAICVSGAGLAYGSFKGIIASAPKNVSLSPKYSSSIIIDLNAMFHTIFLSQNLFFSVRIDFLCSVCFRTLP